MNSERHLSMTAAAKATTPALEISCLVRSEDDLSGVRFLHDLIDPQVLDEKPVRDIVRYQFQSDALPPLHRDLGGCEGEAVCVNFNRMA
jgi:hypothetical protein